MAVSQYWQKAGLRVIPTACWSDERSFDFCFEGMPRKSLVAVSTVGVMNDSEALLGFEKGYNKMLEVLEPAQVLFYGKIPAFIEKHQKNIIFVPASYEKRFQTVEMKKRLQEVNQLSIMEGTILELQE